MAVLLNYVRVCVCLDRVARAGLSTTLSYRNYLNCQLALANFLCLSEDCFNAVRCVRNENILPPLCLSRRFN